MQRDGCGDIGPEPASQVPGTHALVVEVLVEVLVEGHVVVRHQVAHVVQERRCDEVVRGALRARQRRCLERVFEFGDLLVVHAARRG